MHPMKLTSIFPICFIILLGLSNEVQCGSCYATGAGGAQCVTFILEIGNSPLYFPAGFCSTKTKNEPWCVIDEEAAATKSKPNDFTPQDKGITWDTCKYFCSTSGFNIESVTEGK